MKRAPNLRRLAAAALLLAAAGRQPIAADRSSAEAAGGASAETGILRRRVLLSGELEAARSTPIVVPRSRSWNVEIRWLIEDGSAVEAGDRVVEFDNSTLVTRLEELKLQVVEARNALLTADFEARAATAEKELAVESARIEVERARLAAAVPPELLSRLEVEQLGLALERAETELAKALEEQAAERRTRRADLAIRRLEVEKAERESEQVEASLAALTLAAPVAGTVLVGDHPWEGRKLQVGDSVWTGLPVLTFPDPASMRVRAELSDVDDGRIAPGMAASCYLDAYPEAAHACLVQEISPIARQATAYSLRRSFSVLVALADTDPQRMLPGMSVRVEVEPEALTGVRLVPRAAVDFSRDPPRTRAIAGLPAGLPIGPCGTLDCALLEERADAGHAARQEVEPAVGARPVESAAQEVPEARDDLPAPRQTPAPTPVRERLLGWAQAWAGRDAGRYLGFYAGAFRPPGGLDRVAWESQRRIRLEGPAWIEVAIDRVEISALEADRVAVRFLQSYASDRFRSVIWKRQIWVLEEDEWRILEEAAAPSEPGERRAGGGR